MCMVNVTCRINSTLENKLLFSPSKFAEFHNQFPSTNYDPGEENVLCFIWELIFNPPPPPLHVDQGIKNFHDLEMIPSPTLYI